MVWDDGGSNPKSAYSARLLYYAIVGFFYPLLIQCNKTTLFFQEVRSGKKLGKFDDAIDRACA